MRVANVVLKNIKRFNVYIDCNFNEAKRINTISGRNGSGKTTIFESLMLVQKAYFVNRMKDNFLDTYKDTQVDELIGREFFDFIRNNESSITAKLIFERSDFENLAYMRRQYLNEFEEFRPEIPEEFTVEITLSVTEVLTDSVKWNLEVGNPTQKAVLDLFWDLEQPKSIIAYISADKTVAEKDYTFEDVKLDGKNEFSPIVNFIIAPEEIYYNLYSLMINDHIYQRIIPLTPKKNKYYDDAKKLLSDLIPYIKISNFSGKNRENQFILLANSDGNGKNFDVRKFSSGEKLVWYSLLLLTYIEDMGILIIDEPENHLHEELACRFIKLLADLSEQKINYVDLRLGQTFLITHSKTLIYNNFGYGENFVVARDSINKIEYDSCEKTLRSSGLSYTNDKIFFVEGDTEITLLQNLLAERNIKVKELGNCAGIIRTYNGILKVKQYLLDPRFVFLIDRDTRDERSIEDMRSKDPDYFDKHFIVLDKHEIENYFIDIKNMKKVLNEFSSVLGVPEVEVNKIEEIIREIADNQLQYTKKKYMNLILRNKLSTVESLIKQRDLNVDLKENHKRYITELFQGEKWDNLTTDLINVFSQMETTYSEENWEENWLDLLDGKNVFNISLDRFSNMVGVSKQNLEKKLLEAINTDIDSEFMKLIYRIIQMFEVDLGLTNTNNTSV